MVIKGSKGIIFGKYTARGVAISGDSIVGLNCSGFSPEEALQGVIDVAGEHGPIDDISMVNQDLIARVLLARALGRVG